MSHTFGAVAVLVVSVLTVGIGIWGLRFSRTTSDFFVASRTVRPGPQRLGHRRRVPLRRLLPRRRRAGAGVRRRHALVPRRLDRRVPPPARPGRRPAAAVGRVHAPGLRPGPAALAAGPHHHLGPGRGDRLAVPDPPAQGRRLHAQPRHRARQPARRSGRRAGGARQRGHRRDAQRHVRAGLPVLAEADRPAGARRVPAARLVRRRRDVARGPDVRPPRPVGLGRPALGPRAAPDLHDVLDRDRDLPRHHGPAPRGRPLLHQPRRPRGPSHHPGRARPARDLLRAPSGVRRPRPDLRGRPGGRGPGRLRGDPAPAADDRGHGWRAARRVCSWPARSRRSCRRRRA